MGLVVYALDLDRVVRFYAGVLGVDVTERDDSYAVVGDDVVVQRRGPA